jgi:hypothetical protein
VLGLGDLNHLDLVELVLADHASGVTPCTARLGTKARAVRGQLDRQLVSGQHLLAHAVGQRNLGR